MRAAKADAGAIINNADNTLATAMVAAESAKFTLGARARDTDLNLVFGADFVPITNWAETDFWR